MNNKYLFETPLKEGIIIKRNSQFTMDVFIDVNTVRCH